MDTKYVIKTKKGRHFWRPFLSYFLKFANYFAKPIVSTSNTRVEFEGISAPLPRTP